MILRVHAETQRVVLEQTDKQGLSAFWILSNAVVINKKNTGEIIPAQLLFSALSQYSSNNPAPYYGRFKIYEDGELKYTSPKDESTISYTPSTTNIRGLSVELFNAGGTDTRLDYEEIPVVADGSNATTVNLTNDTHSIMTDSSGTPLSGELGASGRAQTDIVVYKGSAALTPVAESATPGPGEYRYVIESVTGCSAVRVDDNTVAISGVSAERGEVKLRIDIEGTEIVVRKAFSWCKSMGGGIDFEVLDCGDYAAGQQDVTRDFDCGEWPGGAAFVAPELCIDCGIFGG